MPCLLPTSIPIPAGSAAADTLPVDLCPLSMYLAPCPCPAPAHQAARRGKTYSGMQFRQDDPTTPNDLEGGRGGLESNVWW